MYEMVMSYFSPADKGRLATHFSGRPADDTGVLLTDRLGDSPISSTPPGLRAKHPMW